MKLSPIHLVAGILLGCSSGQEVTEIHESGQTTAESYLLDRGLEDGLWSIRHENGQLQARGRFENGKGEGLWFHWDENGVLSAEREWKKGRRDGRWADWYENGALKSEGELKNGKREGLWTLWYEKGTQQAEGRFVRDRREGAWKFWDEDRDIKAEGMYAEGERVGDWHFAPEGLKEKKDAVRARADALLQLLRTRGWERAVDFIRLDELTEGERQHVGISPGASEEECREQLGSWFEGVYSGPGPGPVRSVRMDPKDPNLAHVSFRAGDLDGFQMRLTDGEWYFTLE